MDNTTFTPAFTSIVADLLQLKVSISQVPSNLETLAVIENEPIDRVFASMMKKTLASSYYGEIRLQICQNVEAASGIQRKSGETEKAYIARVNSLILASLLPPTDVPPTDAETEAAKVKVLETLASYAGDALVQDFQAWVTAPSQRRGVVRATKAATAKAEEMLVKIAEGTGTLEGLARWFNSFGVDFIPTEDTKLPELALQVDIALNNMLAQNSF